MSDIVEIVKKGLNDLDGKYAAKMANLEDMVRDVAQQQSHVPGLSAKTGPGAAGNSIARLLADSESLKALRERKSRSAIVTADVGLDLLVKTALVGDVASSTTDLYPVMPQRAPGIYNDQRQPLTLIDNLPRLPVNSGSFEYVSIDAAYTDDADYQVNQGDAKAETSLPLELLTANIATVAVTLPCSNQVLADQPALSAFIGSKLSYQVLLKLESEVINGTGGTGKIDGLIHMGSVFVPSSNADAAEAIGEAIAELQTLGWQAGAILLHPRTWQQLRSVRVDAGAGQYLAGGWATPAAPSIWNVPVIATAAMPAGKAVALDLTQVTLLDRQSVTYELGYINDMFQRNQTLCRVEARAGLMVAAPSAVQVFDV